MVSVIFAVLEVSFCALTTVVKLPRKFLTLISDINKSVILKDKDNPFLRYNVLRCIFFVF